MLILLKHGSAEGEPDPFAAASPLMTQDFRGRSGACGRHRREPAQEQAAGLGSGLAALVLGRKKRHKDTPSA